MTENDPSQEPPEKPEPGDQPPEFHAGPGSQDSAPDERKPEGSTPEDSTPEEPPREEPIPEYFERGESFPDNLPEEEPEPDRLYFKLSSQDFDEDSGEFDLEEKPLEKRKSWWSRLFSRKPKDPEPEVTAIDEDSGIQDKVLMDAVLEDPNQQDSVQGEGVPEDRERDDIPPEELEREDTVFEASSEGFNDEDSVDIFSEEQPPEKPQRWWSRLFSRKPKDPEPEGSSLEEDSTKEEPVFQEINLMDAFPQEPGFTDVTQVEVASEESGQENPEVEDPVIEEQKHEELQLEDPESEEPQGEETTFETSSGDFDDEELEEIYLKKKPPEKPKRSWGRIVFRLIFWTVFLLVFCVGALTYMLHYYFPAETVRSIAEREATNYLKTPVTIGKLDFSLFSGLEVQKVQLGAGKKPIARMESLVLDYDLTQLIQGHIVINQVVLDRPEVYAVSKGGRWNFQPLLDLGKGKGLADPKETPKSDGSLPIPFGVDLHDLSVNQVKLHYKQDDQMLADVNGLSLQARGKATADEIDLILNVIMEPPKNGSGPHNLVFESMAKPGISVKTSFLTDLEIRARDLNGARLKGMVGMKDSDLYYGQAIPAPDVRTQMDVALGLKPETVDIHSLFATIGLDNQVELSGKVQSYSKDPRFQATINRASLNLKEVSDWIGHMFHPTRVSGFVGLKDLQVSGFLPGFQPHDLKVSGGQVTMDEVFANHPPVSARIKGLNGVMKVEGAHLLDLVPQQVAANVDFTVSQASALDFEVKGLKQKLRLTGKGPNLPQTRISFSSTAREAIADLPELGTFRSNLYLSGSTSGNLQKGNLSAFKFDGLVGKFLTTHLQGSMRRWGQGGLKVNQDLKLDLTGLGEWLPKKLQEQYGVNRLEGIAIVKSKVNTRLDKSFMPLATKAHSQIDLKGVHADVAQPEVYVENLELSAVLPLEYDPKKGIRAQKADIETKLTSARALSLYQLTALESQVQLDMKKFFPLKRGSGIIPLNNQINMRLGELRIKEPPARVSGFFLNSKIRGDLLPGKHDVRNLTLTGNMGYKETQALEQIQTGPARSDFVLDIHDISLAKSRIDLKTRIQSPAYKSGDLDLKFDEASLTALARMDIPAGDVDLELAQVSLPGIIEGEAEGTVKDWGQSFDLKGNVPQLDLNTIMNLLPSAYKKGFETLKLSGGASLSLAARGKKPSEKEMKSLKIPVALKANMGLQNVAVDWPDQKIKIEGLNQNTQLEVKDQTLFLSGDLKGSRVFKTDFLGEQWVAPTFVFNYEMDQWNKISFKKHQLNIPQLGLQHTITGRIDGLKPFLSKRVSTKPRDLLRFLDVAITTKNSLKVDKVASGVKGMKTRGGLSSNISINLAPKQEVILDGDVGFDHFHLAKEPGLEVNDVQGKFNFNKKLALDRDALKTDPSGFNIAEKGFFNQLREFSRNKNIIKIASLVYKPYEVTDVGMDLFFKNNRLAAEKFLFDLLKGSMAGQLFLEQTPQGPVLKFHTEFAGLDFNELIGEQVTPGGEASAVDGNMQFGFEITQGTENERITLDQIQLKLAITRIGEEAMDRVLLFLDPEESKPAIVDTRAKLKLANPHKFLLTLDHGNLNIETWLKSSLVGGILKAPELKRLPVTSLKQFAQIQDQLQMLSGFRDVLSYLAAQGLEISKDGKVTLF